MDKKEYDRLYYIKNKEERKKKVHEYYKKNKEKLKETSKTWYEKNKEHCRRQAKIRYKKNYPKYKHIKSKMAKERWKNYREEIYTLLGGKKCVMCGFSDERALAIDHINNDGYLERSDGKNMSKMKRLVFENPSRYQILCFNCNIIKEKEYVKKNKRKRMVSVPLA